MGYEVVRTYPPTPLPRYTHFDPLTPAKPNPTHLSLARCCTQVLDWGSPNAATVSHKVSECHPLLTNPTGQAQGWGYEEQVTLPLWDRDALMARDLGQKHRTLSCATQVASWPKAVRGRDTDSKRQKGKVNHSTQDSRVVPHRGTN